MELGNLDVRGYTLYFSLENCDLSVLFSKQLLLAHDFLIFSVVLGLNFLNNCGLLFGLHLLFSLGNALFFLLELCLLLSAVFLQLDFSLCKTRFFLDKACHNFNVLLLDS